jgi:hypothetical protein
MSASSASMKVTLDGTSLTDDSDMTATIVVPNEELSRSALIAMYLWAGHLRERDFLEWTCQYADRYPLQPY